MKNVENAKGLFYQTDHEVKSLYPGEGVILISSPEAYEKFGWTQSYFEEEPEEGYFLWIRKQVDFPLSTCVSIVSPEVSQELRNLVVIEEGVHTQINSTCNTIKEPLAGHHNARTKYVLKAYSSLEVQEYQRWGEKDVVNTNKEFYLGKKANLTSLYKSLHPPEKLQLSKSLHEGRKASASLLTVFAGKNSEVEMHDSISLNGENAKGISKIRIVGKMNSKVTSRSKLVANKAGTGHLDCTGLLIADTAEIDLIPELDNKAKNASLTHEASVGKISERILNYLKSKGLTEEEAIDMVVTGFLGEEHQLEIKESMPTKSQM